MRTNVGRLYIYYFRFVQTIDTLTRDKHFETINIINPMKNN